MTSNSIMAGNLQQVQMLIRRNNTLEAQIANQTSKKTTENILPLLEEITNHLNLTPNQHQDLLHRIDKSKTKDEFDLLSTRLQKEITTATWAGENKSEFKVRVASHKALLKDINDEREANWDLIKKRCIETGYSLPQRLNPTTKTSQLTYLKEHILEGEYGELFPINFRTKEFDRQHPLEFDKPITEELVAKFTVKEPFSNNIILWKTLSNIIEKITSLGLNLTQFRECLLVIAKDHYPQLQPILKSMENPHNMIGLFNDLLPGREQIQDLYKTLANSSRKPGEQLPIFLHKVFSQYMCLQELLRPTDKKETIIKETKNQMLNILENITDQNVYKEYVICKNTYKDNFEHIPTYEWSVKTIERLESNTPLSIEKPLYRNGKGMDFDGRDHTKYQTSTAMKNTLTTNKPSDSDSETERPKTRQPRKKYRNNQLERRGNSYKGNTYRKYSNTRRQSPYTRGYSPRRNSSKSYSPRRRRYQTPSPGRRNTSNYTTDSSRQSSGSRNKRNSTNNSRYNKSRYKSPAQRSPSPFQNNKNKETNETQVNYTNFRSSNTTRNSKLGSYKTFRDKNQYNNKAYLFKTPHPSQQPSGTIETGQNACIRCLKPHLARQCNFGYTQYYCNNCLTKYGLKLYHSHQDCPKIQNTIGKSKDTKNYLTSTEDNEETETTKTTDSDQETTPYTLPDPHNFLE